MKKNSIKRKENSERGTTKNSYRVLMIRVRIRLEREFIVLTRSIIISGKQTIATIAMTYGVLDLRRLSETIRLTSCNMSIVRYFNHTIMVLS